MTKKLKKPIAFLTVFAMLMTMLLYFPAGTFCGFGLGVRASAEIPLEAPTFGDGSSNDPYILKTKGNLYWFANQANYVNSGICAKLGNNITVNSNVLDSNWNLNSGTFDEWTPIDDYGGTFDGNNYTISGIYVNNTDTSVQCQGFFGSIGRLDKYSGYVQNLTIKDSYISGADYHVGGICGAVNFGTISNCTFKGVVKGTEYVGGISGRFMRAYVNADIQNCKSYGKVIGTEEVGGIVGSVYGDPSKEYTQTIKRCENHAEVSGEYMVGGLFGYIKNYKVNLEDCHNYGDVTLIEKNIDTFIGGICGLVGTSQYSYPIVTVNNCTNSGSITGRSYVGGIFGHAMIFWGNTNTFKNCSNSGSISGRDRVGGLLGCVRSAEVSDCCNTGAVRGEEFVGGICGLSYGDETKFTRVFNTGKITGTVQYIGGLFGKTEGSVQYVTESYNTGEVDGTGAQGVGGIIGSTSAGSMPQLTKNCYNTGKITGLKNVGGISGVSGCTNTASVEYCFNTGEVTATGGSAYGLVSSGGEAYVTISNSYYDVDVNPDSKMTIYNIDKIAKRMPTSAFESGEVAYLLQAGGGNWGQRVSRDIFNTLDNQPVLTTGSTSSKYRVYYAKYPEDVDYYHNHNSGAVCEVCPFNPVQPSVIDGVYQISDSGELLWFSQYVNGTLDATVTHPDAKAVLTASFSINSDLLNKVEGGNTANENVWQPIGSTTAFTGSFDGQGHTISGLYYDDTEGYIGLFAKIGSGGKVTNVGMNDSYFNGSDNVGGIAGQNAGEISNCFFFKGKVNASSTNMSGICGSNSGSVTNCYYLAASETDSIDGTTAQSENSFTNGEVAYKLNDNPSEPVWGQLIITDDFPVQIDNANTVYYGRKNPVYHNHTADMTYCDDCPAYFGAATDPILNSENKYEITDVDELYWFAKYVNSGNTGAHAVLMNDIEVNQGVLDANGNLISDKIPYWTPIGTNSNPFTGSFDGQCFKISGLYVDNSADNIGLFGVIGNGGSVSNVGVIDSYFSGNDYVGGIAGKNGGTITGCFSMSTVSATGSNIGGISGSGGTVNHSFYLSDSDSGEAKTADQFTNGDVAFNLNSSQNSPVWGQEIDSDLLPVSYNGENRVYFAQDTYHNHNSGESCDLCKVILPTEPVSVNGVYQITKASELEWFARFVNSGNTTVKAVLKNDIKINADVIADDGTVNSGTFLTITSVGTQTNPFNGSFNGDGYTIGGLYFNNASESNVGLFGFTGSSASITKLRIADSYFNANQYVGSICGNNAGNISECCTENCVVTGKYAGGLCGSNSGTIKNCYNTGKVSGDKSGGICGSNSGTVSYCYTTGKLSGNNNGGVCGSGTCENSYYLYETAPDISSGIGTPISLIELTKDDILTVWGAGSEWVKTSNDLNNKRLYFLNLSAIRSSDLSVDYTPKFILKNNNTTPILYEDDLKFTFETVLDVSGIGEIHTPIIVSPTDLQPSNYSFSHNDEPFDLGTLTFDYQSSSRLDLRINGRYAGYFIINFQTGIINVYFAEDINVGTHKIDIAYNGTGNPFFTGTSATCTFIIKQAQPTINIPSASDITYGESLAESVLKDSSGNTDSTWIWLDSTIVPAVSQNEQTIVSASVVDDVNYDYSNVEGYDPTTHLVKRTITLTIERAVPSIVVKADPSAVNPGKTVQISAAISNPNNSTLNDLPTAEFSYIIGSGAEQAITNGSFVIPEDTALGTVITIIARTSATDNYASGYDDRTTVTVTDCTHAKKVLKYDESRHWYHCDNCGADLDVEAHYGGTATCTNKAVCTLCKQEYGTVDNNNHTNVSTVWSADDTGHWHECADCHAQVDKADHTSSGPATSEQAEICTICNYEINPKLGHVSTPVISPNGGTFINLQEITITCRTDGAEIYYTTDGTSPTTGSKKYTEPFTISATTTVKAIAVKLGLADSDVVSVTYTKKSTNKPGPAGPVTPTDPSKPLIGGSEMSWSDIVKYLEKLPIGSEVTIELNGNTNVPVQVIKVIADRKLKVTFVCDAIRSWKTDGAKITTPAAADFTCILTASQKHNGLRGVEGIQFSINKTNIPTDLAISFKADFAGKFANLYRSTDGKLVFVTCAKLGTNGKAILPDVDDKGNYVAMLCEFSDRSGDMNNDGVLNAMDASAILKDVVGLEPGKNPLMADFNGDGLMNAIDASTILKRIVGLA